MSLLLGGLLGFVQCVHEIFEVFVAILLRSPDEPGRTRYVEKLFRLQNGSLQKRDAACEFYDGDCVRGWLRKRVTAQDS